MKGIVVHRNLLEFYSDFSGKACTTKAVSFQCKLLI